MAWYNWSRTAATNATADASINWAEGQAPSSVNDSARAMMAATAKFRDDIAGAIVTAGTSTAYTVASFSVFDSFAHMDKQVIAFSPHTTNAAGPVSLNVDGLGTRVLRSSPGVDLLAGTLIQGTPYLATYSNADTAWYLQGFFGNPYNIPLGGGMDYWGPTAPNSSFVFPFGQAISRTTYATLFSLVGSTYGAGDGSTTFNIPDLRGRVTARPDNMGGGSDPNRLTVGALAGVRNSIGGAGGESAHTLTAAEIPSITSAGSATGSLTGAITAVAAVTTTGLSGGGSSVNIPFAASSIGVTVSGALTVAATSNNTGGGTHNVMQPTILCNYIMRII